VGADDPFSPIPLFAFPLFSTVLAGFDQRKDALLADILEHKRHHPGMTRSNYHGWHSGDEFVGRKSEPVGWVLQKALEFSRLALARYNQDWARTELRLGRYWANVLGPRGWNAPHHHFPQHWSGVFYVSVGRIGNGVDDMDGMIEFLNPTPWHAVIGGGGNFAYGPKNGLMLLFPSSILHFVHPHEGEDLRVSIAFNLNVVPRS
jgi:uncharacterized protein (TIGR02466 family)